ncbi:MAG: flippase-like protein [Nocardioides sp.]|nr:flippase-like protein [Nocardioides sp.]
MSASWWRRARWLGGVAILAVLVRRLGTGPFVDGVRLVDARSLAAAAALGVVTTVCSAWRWRLVAEALGAGTPLPGAVAAYYRSQFLNSTLPGGVLGDVHRGVRHGRDTGDLGTGLRAVVWERAAGQVVLLGLTGILLLLLPSPVRLAVPAVELAVLAVAVVLVRARTPRALLSRRVLPGVLGASVVVVAGHTLTFLVAARAAGSTASIAHLLPLALVVLVAMGLPVNVAGWGPREGVAAWAFAAAGLGAATGVATAVVYGVIGLVATLPGAVVLLADRVPRGRPVPVGRLVGVRRG